MSPAVSPAEGASSGPKMLSKSAIEGFLVELSASVDASETQPRGDQSEALFAEVFSKFTEEDRISQREVN